MGNSSYFISSKRVWDAWVSIQFKNIDALRQEEVLARGCRFAEYEAGLSACTLPERFSSDKLLQ
ncbi:MAG: hypothetical protein A2X94_17555 [Bdellovibrionales bacterium GWB1_55_8]|nr:MAG: hypothetical protein A2X94_17555 [Bdellovibrionales bacterium GWB1_55_8]